MRMYGNNVVCFNFIQTIELQFYAQIETSTGCCNGSPKNKIPITIGTYPIDDVDPPPRPRIASVPDSVAEDSVDKGRFSTVQLWK